MASSRKKREAGRRRSQKEKRLPESGHEKGAFRSARLVKPDIQREIRHITQLALAEDSRIVTLGNLVLFSTRTRDAWLLDPEDDFALCLCRDGVIQPVSIIDSPTNFAIDWAATFAIDGADFIVQERFGKVIVIRGYPTVEIAAACRR